MSAEEPEGEASTGALGPFLRRLAGALHLQAKTYDEVAEDPAATQQAAVVVGLATLAQAFGGPEPLSVSDLPQALALAYFSWLIPGTLVWLMGTRALSETADLPRVLRCLGFATAPQLLWIIGTFARESGPFDLALGVVIFGLALAASILAIRQAFIVSTPRALVIFALGFLAFAGVALVLGAVFSLLGIAL